MEVESIAGNLDDSSTRINAVSTCINRETVVLSNHENLRPEWRKISTIIIAGSLASLCVGWIGSPWLTTTFLGTLLSVLLAFAWQANSKRGTSSPTLLETPFYLAHDAEVFDRYRKLAQEMLRISGHADPIYRNCALESLDKSLAEISVVGDGRIVFHDTETWRLIYEKLLRDPSATVYRSVALVRDPDYWQDGAGSQSMKLNFELISQYDYHYRAYRHFIRRIVACWQ